MLSKTIPVESKLDQYMSGFGVTVVLLCRKMGETQYYTLSLRYKRGGYKIQVVFCVSFVGSFI